MLFNKILKPIFNLFLSFFFDSKMLNSRYFKTRKIGYVWCFRSLIQRNILRLAKPLPFPASLTANISNPENIIFDFDDINNFQSPGTYFQCFSGSIIIGKGTYIAPNVGLITVNHDLNDLDNHGEAKNIILGKKCWIGMNSVILPGVELADEVIVAAGAVVTKSCAQSRVILGGVPAKIIKSY